MTINGLSWQNPPSDQLNTKEETTIIVNAAITDDKCEYLRKLYLKMVFVCVTSCHLFPGWCVYFFNENFIVLSENEVYAIIITIMVYNRCITL
jgi:hypothetical protein